MKSALAILAICATFTAMAAPGAAPSATARTGDTLRLDPTAANVKRVRAALHAARSENDKIDQIRLLATLYSRSNASGMNDAIVSELRALAGSPSRRVARSATYPLAQAVGADETIEILLRAKRAGLMESEEVAGELARALRFAPREQQLRLVQLIGAEQSRYGVDVMVAGFGSKLLDPMLPETRQAVGDLLRRTRIDFPRNTDSFGYVDAIRYAGWLHASALTEQWVSRQPYEITVLAHLDDPELDPRKLIAYLGTPEGKELMVRVGKRGPFAGAVRRARDYAAAYPHSLHVQKIVCEIYGSWNSLPA
ncbi:hypothetical protein INH39_27125 [Massilia violaceinigra]|uniref:HEAT repeat domain-containing protein n=1 Tax=Massilia violaceinigra TaxID=2045208 RepID=A0ABY4A8X5_9BURK|nr:hypothetical protein [Massilia violaceinigra]UOD29063.1 hypothetical protein INH39_27125 [Massilia violaceinigra]